MDARPLYVDSTFLGSHILGWSGLGSLARGRGELFCRPPPGECGSLCWIRSPRSVPGWNSPPGSFDAPQCLVGLELVHLDCGTCMLVRPGRGRAISIGW